MEGNILKSKYSIVSRAVALSVAAMIVVSGCGNSTGKTDNPTTSAQETIPQETTPAPTEPVKLDEELIIVVTEDTISQLEEYPNLKKADLTGSLCYDAILEYMDKHPDVTVIYTVSIGATDISNDVISLELTDEQFDYAVLKDNLKYLPNVAAVTFNNTGLTEAQIKELRDTYTEVAVKYTVPEPETEAPTPAPAPAPEVITDTKIELNSSWPVYDWTNIDSAQIDSAVEDAKALTGTCVVKLNSSLTKADVKKLQQAAPNVIFDYSFSLYGKTLSTLSNTVSFVNVNIGDAGEQAIRESLDILTKCTYFKLDGCGLSNEVVAGIRDTYAGRTEVVWRIYSWQRSWLTDTTVLRAVYHVDDSNSGPFKYLTKVKYVDLGHNTDMKDLSFLGYMPDLEIAILSGSPITDVSPLANCKKLEFLELAWCGWLTDITPLAQCTGLKNLNLGHTRVADLSPVKNLALEQLSYVNSGNRVGFTADDWAKIKEQHPNCIVTYEPLADNNATPYSIGWRYKAEGGYTACYRKVRDVFNYDEIDKQIQSGMN